MCRLFPRTFRFHSCFIAEVSLISSPHPLRSGEMYSSSIYWSIAFSSYCSSSSFPITPPPSDRINFFIEVFRSISYFVSSGPGLGLATARAIVVEVISVFSHFRHCIATRSFAPPPTISSLQWGRLIQKASDGLPTNVYLLTSGSLKRK